MSNVGDLNPTAVGIALITLTVTSKLMGHASAAHTARDYLMPHDTPRSAEQQFVYELLVHGVDAVISSEEAISILGQMDLPPLEPVRPPSPNSQGRRTA